MTGPIAGSELDLDRLVAIDVHTHAEVSEDGQHYSLPDNLMEASAAYFSADQDRAPSLDAMAAYYRERTMAAVVFTVDAEHNLGHPPIANEEVAAAAKRHPDVLIPFASVDPHRPDAAARAERLISDHGVRGFKFHPTLQGFSPNDRLAYPILDVLAAAGVPALFHSGQSGIGAGLPGGGGLRLKYSNPMLLDDVAADFPTLTIIIAHPSYPWQDEALAVAVHKANVHIDLSGWSPKYFPPQLVRYANTMLKHKVLFGSDFPVITPDRWLKDFAALDIKDDVRPLILRDNAIRVLGLSAGAGRAPDAPPRESK
jgi:predicted TIM-barrel fold metal-dependent hydrolase